MPCIICDSESEIKKFRYLCTDFFECTECGLVRTLPFPAEAQIVDHYRKKFDCGNYSTLRSHMDSYQAIYESYISLIKIRAGNLEGKRILDIGCFSGDFLDLARREGALTYGIELQKDAYEIAAARHGERILNCSFEKAVFDIKFDIITLFGVIEHVTHPEALLKMTSSLLVEGGLVVIQTPNAGSFFAKVMQKYWPPYAPIEHIHYFSRVNIHRLLEKFNFTRIETRRHFKKLSIHYVYGMLLNFGPEFHSLLSPLIKMLPDWLKSRKMTFYVGEMLVTAEKRSGKDIGY